MVFETFARQRKQGSQQQWGITGIGSPLEHRHRGQPLRPRATQQLQEDGLRLVVGMMRERHHVGAGAVQSRVPGATRDFFKTLARLSRHRDPLHAQRNPQPAACRHTVVRPCVGIGRQAVMHMQRAQSRAAALYRVGQNVQEDR